MSADGVTCAVSGLCSNNTSFLPIACQMLLVVHTTWLWWEWCMGRGPASPRHAPCLLPWVSRVPLLIMQILSCLLKKSLKPWPQEEKTADSVSCVRTKQNRKSSKLNNMMWPPSSVPTPCYRVVPVVMVILSTRRLKVMWCAPGLRFCRWTRLIAKWKIIKENGRKQHFKNHFLLKASSNRPIMTKPLPSGCSGNCVPFEV